MPRPDPRAPGAGQDELFEPTEMKAVKRTGTVLRGRHSVAGDKALEAARSAELIADVDGALASVVRAGMWALDQAEASGGSAMYVPSKVMQPLTEALRELHMTPDSRGTDTEGSIAELAAQLGAIKVDDDEPALPDTAP